MSSGAVERSPAVAGQFYPADSKELRKVIEWCFRHELGPGDLPEANDGPCALPGVVAPHAGYQFSGPVAAHTYKVLAESGTPETVVILGPNHTGLGSAVATMTDGAWRTPLGSVEIDSEFATALVRECGVMDDDLTSHANEHSIEVQLPFLQYVYGTGFRFVPVCMAMHDLQTAREVGEAIVDVAKELDRNTVVIASTDFTHYEPHDQAQKKDRKVIERITALDEAGMIEIVERYNVSMCGVGPTAATIVAVKAMGASDGELLKYATSGEVSGDYSQVVGYAAIVFRCG